MFIFSSLTHKNVLQFYGIYTSPENVKYIVTEYLNKGALRDLLLEEYNTIAVSDLISMYKRFFLAFVNCFLDVWILRLEWRILQTVKLYIQTWQRVMYL